MRKLNQREKILLGVVVVLAVGIFTWILIGGDGGFSLGLSSLKTKKSQLDNVNIVIDLSKKTTAIDQQIWEQTGLKGRIISDSLLNEIQRKDLFDDINNARRQSEVAALLPAFKDKANLLMAYRRQVGGQFENPDQLKEIEGRIFTGEQPEVVIADRISELAKGAGLKPNYQLNIKAQPGQKSERISAQAKEILVSQLYIGASGEELAELQEEQQQIEEEAETAMNSIYDVWGFGSNETNDYQEDEDNSEDASQKQQEVDEDSNISDTTNEYGQQNEPNNQTKREDESIRLPTAMPLTVRIQLLEFLQEQIELQILGIAESRRGFFADQIEFANPTKKSGIFAKRSGTNGPVLKPNGPLLTKFNQLIANYQEDSELNNESGEAEPLDYSEMVSGLTVYADSARQQEENLSKSLAKVALTYQPKVYFIEINIRGGIDQIGKFIYAIEDSSKWIYVKGLKINIADKNKRTLGINLSLAAKIL